jgi:hypothetical protein
MSSKNTGKHREKQNRISGAKAKGTSQEGKNRDLRSAEETGREGFYTSRS